MFFTTVTNTNVTVFGNVQGCVVKSVVKGLAPATSHLMARTRLAMHASLRRCRSLADLRWLAAVARDAARLAEACRLAITGLALCPQPVLSRRQSASVRG